MSEVLQANIFFVVASIAVVAVTILVCCALFYFVLILRNVRDITDRLKRGSEQLAEDAQAVRNFLSEGVIGAVRSFFSRSAPPRKKTSPRPKKADDIPVSTEM